MTEPITGIVKNGKFEADVPKAFAQAFRFHEGRRVVVTVKRFQNKRSPEANAYYWAVVVAYWMREYGEGDANNMHEILKTAYNYQPRLVGDQVLQIPMPTRNLESGKFAAFVDRCKDGFKENYNGEIPPPSSAVSLEMIEEYNRLGNSKEEG